jgi:hypothetical protein
MFKIRRFNGSYVAKSFKSARGAKISASKMGMARGSYSVIPVEEIPMVEKVSIMTGKTFWEREDTPSFCSPASESYWSM